MAIETFNGMIGKTIARIVGGKGDGLLCFIADDGVEFRFYHSQDCCESVAIDDIVGELADLQGSPILIAEEISSDGAPAPKHEYVESYTWTFYRFATVKGTVTVKWLGESNGYYSESVDYAEVTPSQEGDEVR